MLSSGYHSLLLLANSGTRPQSYLYVFIFFYYIFRVRLYIGTSDSITLALNLKPFVKLYII